jgi:hypothetical protein
MKRSIEVSSRHHRHTSSVSSLGSVSSEIDWIIKQELQSTRFAAATIQPSTFPPSVLQFAPEEGLVQSSSKDSDPHSPYYRRRRLHVLSGNEITVPLTVPAPIDADKDKLAPELPVLELPRPSMTPMVTVLARSSPEINALCKSFCHAQDVTSLIDLARSSYSCPPPPPPSPPSEAGDVADFRTPPTKRPLFDALRSPPPIVSNDNEPITSSPPRVARIPTPVSLSPEKDDPVCSGALGTMGMAEQLSPTASDDSAAVLSANLNRVRLRDDSDGLDDHRVVELHPSTDAPLYWDSLNENGLLNRRPETALGSTRKVTDSRSETNLERSTPVSTFSYPPVNGPISMSVPLPRTEQPRRRSSAPSQLGKQTRTRLARKSEAMSRLGNAYNPVDFSSCAVIDTRKCRGNERRLSWQEHFIEACLSCGSSVKAASSPKEQLSAVGAEECLYLPKHIGNVREWGADLFDSLYCIEVAKCCINITLSSKTGHDLVGVHTVPGTNRWRHT